MNLSLKEQSEHTVKLRPAIGEDFKYYIIGGNHELIPKFKIGFPFYRKTENGFSFDITKHTEIENFKVYLEKFKTDISAGKIYVLDADFNTKMKLTQ